MKLVWRIGAVLLLLCTWIAPVTPRMAPPPVAPHTMLLLIPSMPAPVFAASFRFRIDALYVVLGVSPIA